MSSNSTNSASEKGSSDSLNMRSIWTRVHGSDQEINKYFAMQPFYSMEDLGADQVQIPESGGGEGIPAVAAAPAPTAPEAKPDTPVETPKAEAPTAAKPEAPKLDEPKEAKPEQLPIIQPEQPKEVKSDEPREAKQEVAPVPESKVETTPVELKQTTAEVKLEANGVAENVTAPNEQGDWQQRETELLKKIDELEKVKKERTQESLLLELKVREEEIDLLKARVKNLETELQAAVSKPSGKNHEMIENIKQQHEELLSKARGMIFDKTKMVKNQELQIEALNTQIQSLKDINQITKDLLEIRNSEIKAMEDRLQAMEARFKAEKDRYGLVLQRAQTSSNINDDLRKEYETQLALFKQLREKYDQRVQALVAENERLKGINPANASGPGAGPSA